MLCVCERERKSVQGRDRERPREKEIERRWVTTPNRAGDRVNERTSRTRALSRVVRGFSGGPRDRRSRFDEVQSGLSRSRSNGASLSYHQNLSSKSRRDFES